jgi:uncharacterized membrane protein
MKLNEQEKSHVKLLAAQVESRTGVQIVAAATVRSDSYPEIPWKAFSMGVALAALTLVAGSGSSFVRHSIPSLVCGVAVLGSGMVFSLASIFLQPFTRAFLNGERAAEETKQYAQSLFLERGFSRTESRKAVLLLASQLERRAAVVADTGILDRIPQAELQKAAEAAEAGLAGGGSSTALAAGLAVLEEVLVQFQFSFGVSKDEIQEEFLEAEGPQP